VKCVSSRNPGGRAPPSRARASDGSYHSYVNDFSQEGRPEPWACPIAAGWFAVDMGMDLFSDGEGGNAGSIIDHLKALYKTTVGRIQALLGLGEAATKGEPRSRPAGVRRHLKENFTRETQPKWSFISREGSTP